jgi:hypothetical protein
MEHDAKVKRAIFIENSTNIRELFEFAHPAQVLQAVNVYASHFYGSMLWNLYGVGANQVFRSWNTCAKLAWGVPRWSHNYFVEHVLSAGIPHVRQKILGQYLGFTKKLMNSDSPEIRILANSVARDAAQLAERYKCYCVPAEDEWRLPLLVNLLDQRREMSVCEERTKSISEMIDSLCYSLNHLLIFYRVSQALTLSWYSDYKWKITFLLV